jgi:hypothetical protein
MTKWIALAAAGFAVVHLAACEGGAERAGENLDSAVEEAVQGEENLGDGPLERAGESIDEATGATRSGDAADALNDATDGEASTNP